MVIDRKIIDPGKGHIAEIALSTIEEEEIILTEITGLIIELGADQEMIMEIEGMTGLIIDKATEEKISDKIMVSKDIEQEVQVMIKIGLTNDIGTSPEVRINVVETRVGTEDSGPEMFQEIEETDQFQSPGLDQAPL